MFRRYLNLRKQLIILSLLLFIVICTSYLRDSKAEPNYDEDVVFYYGGSSNKSRTAEKTKVTLAVVACGGRYEQALTMLKSAALFSREPFHVVAIVDQETRPSFAKSIKLLHSLSQGEQGKEFSYEILDTWFPSADQDIWKKLYAPCSAQRIFFPSLLPKVDSLLYMDSDTLFVSDPKDIWRHFDEMNSVQWVGAVNEDEPSGDGWYNTKAEIPYFKPRGINTGVLLMNLTRMRTYRAERRAVKALKQFGDKLYWGDQDIFNIMFSWNPEFVYPLPCEYNFRESHCFCKYKGDCKCGSATNEGVRIVHGNLKAFQKRGHFFQSIYNVFNEHSLSKGKLAELYTKLKKAYDAYFQGSPGTGCVETSHRFFKNINVV